MRKFKESNSEADSLCQVLQLYFYSYSFQVKMYLEGDLSCSLMVSDYWDELLAQKFYLYYWVQKQPQERKIPPFLLLWTLWDLGKDFIKPLTMTSWYMRLHIGQEQSDNPKGPAWRSSSCFWQVPGEWHKSQWRSIAYRGKWKLCCGRCL